MEPGVVEIVLGALNILLGFLLHTLWATVRDLQESDKTLTDKVAALEVSVIGNYVTKREFDARLDKLDAKLDRIYEKLERLEH